MASVRNNPLLDGMSGALGDIVLRRTPGGKTVMSRKPRFAADRQFSAAQLAHQRRFRAAAAYARQAARTEPVYAALAAQRGRPAYNVALADYLHPPEVIAVERTGLAVRVRAVDDARVTRVMVEALDADGMVTETVEAAPLADEWWQCQVRAGTARVRAGAYDPAGNVTWRDEGSEG